MRYEKKNLLEMALDRVGCSDLFLLIGFMIENFIGTRL